MKHGILLLALPLALCALSFASGCRNDPVENAIIDALPNDPTPNGPLHRAGEPCLACHDTYGGATPFAIGGTVYALDSTMTHILPASQIRVTILDSNSGDSRNVCSNAAGNFFVESWSDLTFPLSPTAGGVAMQSLIGRDGSCATCHTLPNAQSLEPVTGAGPASAGVILVSPSMADPTCPTTP